MSRNDFTQMSDEELINFAESETEKAQDSMTVCMADVQAEEVEWLWHPYIPRSKLTLIEGDPGLGKSWLALAIATAITRGCGLPGMPSTEPASVLLLTAEDGLGDTIRPRLDTLEADTTRVFALDAAIIFDDAGLLVLEGSIIEHKPSLVVIDPLVAYLGSGVDLHRANETRSITRQLAAIAERRRCAILAVRHLSKSSQSRTIYRGLGSIDLTAACRSVLLAGCDPDSPSRRALVQIKNNLAEFGKSVGYKIEDGKFFWLAESNLTAEKILSFGSGEDERSALAEAEDFLRQVLASGPKKSKDIQHEARSLDISDRTLRRARQTLGVKVRRRGESGKRDAGEWYWYLHGQHDLGGQENTFGHLNREVSETDSLSVEEARVSSDDLDGQTTPVGVGHLNQPEMWDEV